MTNFLHILTRPAVNVSLRGSLISLLHLRRLSRSMLFMPTRTRSSLKRKAGFSDDTRSIRPFIFITTIFLVINAAVLSPPLWRFDYFFALQQLSANPLLILRPPLTFRLRRLVFRCAVLHWGSLKCHLIASTRRAEFQKLVI